MIKYLSLFLAFLKIGMFTIGGGMVIIPLISDLIIEKGWFDEHLLNDFIGVSESTPGAFAVNFAVFVGYQMGGVIGSFFALLGLFLPSFIIILIIFKISTKLVKNKPFQAAMHSLKAAVVGIILAFLIKIAFSSFYSDVLTGTKMINWIGILMTVSLFAFYKKFNKLNPVFLIIISATLGMIIYSIVY